MLQRLPSQLRPIVEPVCPKCKVSMYGVNLIPGFAVFSNRIFQCFKCGHMEGVYPVVGGKRHAAALIMSK
jgi:hypothetical protein